jgi:DNA-directed RNA polymerase specialized sigma54-like protein
MRMSPKITDKYLAEKYPVYMAGHKRKEELQVVGEFLEWLEEKGYLLHEYKDVEEEAMFWDDDTEKYVAKIVDVENKLCRVRHNIEALLLLFVGLDPEEYRKQKAAVQDEVLKKIRDANERRGRIEGGTTPSDARATASDTGGSE